MFIVVELQTNNGVTSNIVTAYATRNAAESAYHSILAAAAVSNVEVHAAIVMSEEGYPLMHMAYRHGTT